VICGGSVYNGGSLLGRYPQVSFSDTNGSNFSAPQKIKLENKMGNNYDWIWRVSWNNDIGYGIDYQVGPKERHGPTQLFLVKTKDGISYDSVYKFNINGFPNESTIRFDKDNNMYVLIRRELGDKKGVLGVSAPPYKDWTFHKLPMRLGGPNFIFLNKEHLILGTRTYKDKNGAPKIRTKIFLTDLKGKVDTSIQLKSGDDTSYPGLLIYNDTLWISYYSNHQNNHTSIFLAKIHLEVVNN